MKRTDFLHIRLSEEEKTAIDVQAVKENMSTSEYVRNCCIGKENSNGKENQ